MTDLLVALLCGSLLAPVVVGDGAALLAIPLIAASQRLRHVGRALAQRFAHRGGAPAVLPSHSISLGPQP